MSHRKRQQNNATTDKDILSLYEAILSNLYRPDRGTTSIPVQKYLRRFVSFDACQYIVQRETETTEDNIESTTQSLSGNKLTIRIQNTPLQTASASFHNQVKLMDKMSIEKGLEKRPWATKYDQYKIKSRKVPRIALIFTRFYNAKKERPFTNDEKRIFKKITPHLLVILRTLATHNLHSESQNHLKMHLDICSKLATRFSLTDREYKIMLEMLSGQSNEVIAKNHFVTVFAVKKNIKSIFTKTHSKNRIDFISRYFTSPEHLAE